ncbi:MAG: glycosyltransferase family 2 protein [Burkholderiales bacterium]|nr:MAG: glycosyltransferase family 2 protein [Burkholderiales bacterium]
MSQRCRALGSGQRLQRKHRQRMTALSITCVATDETHATLTINVHGASGDSDSFEQSIDDALPPFIRDIEALSITLDAKCASTMLPRVLLIAVRRLARAASVALKPLSADFNVDHLRIECVFGLKLTERSARSYRFERTLAKSNDSTPGLVSILIAAWNPRYFEKALRSALAQTYSSIEILIGDDCPDTAIKQIVDRVSSPKFPIHYCKNEPRLMVRANYEACFNRARGEFIKYLNDDDLLEPNCVVRMVESLTLEPTAVLATSARSLIDEVGGPKQDLPATKPLVPVDSFIDGQSLVNALLLLGLNFIGEPSTVMFRKELAQLGDEPLFDFAGESGRGVTDFVLWSKLLCRGDAVYLRERLSSFRVHREQRQANPEVQRFAVDSVPALRNQWLALAGHFAMPASLLRSRALLGDSFALHPIELFGATESNKHTLLAQWAARTHLFFHAEG